MFQQCVDLRFQIELILGGLQVLVAYEDRFFQRRDANSNVQNFCDLQQVVNSLRLSVGEGQFVPVSVGGRRSVSRSS